MVNSRKLLEGLKQYRDSLTSHQRNLDEDFQQLQAKWQSFNGAAEGDYIRAFTGGWAKTENRFKHYIDKSRKIVALLDERIASLDTLNRGDALIAGGIVGSSGSRSTSATSNQDCGYKPENLWTDPKAMQEKAVAFVQLMLALSGTTASINPIEVKKMADGMTPVYSYIVGQNIEDQLSGAAEQISSEHQDRLKQQQAESAAAARRAQTSSGGALPTDKLPAQKTFSDKAHAFKLRNPWLNKKEVAKRINQFVSITTLVVSLPSSMVTVKKITNGEDFLIYGGQSLEETAMSAVSFIGSERPGHREKEKRKRNAALLNSQRAIAMGSTNPLSSKL